MAKKLELFIPAKPFNITQAWGILNPIYASYGYTRHNGVDFSVDKDGIVEAMCDGVVTETGYNDDNGNYVRYKTGLVNVNDRDCFVEFVYLHASKILVKAGQNLTAGTPLILAGNTGKSTGPHTHISAYRIDSYGKKLDWNDAFGSFDWTKYLLPYHSADIGELLKQIWSIIINKNI